MVMCLQSTLVYDKWDDCSFEKVNFQSHVQDHYRVYIA